MNIPWEKFLVSAAVGFIGLSLLKPKVFQANQGFGFSGAPIIQLTPDVATVNCKPAGTYDSHCGTSAKYRYSANDESMGYYACGVTCADARAVYQNKYNPGNSVYGATCPTCGTDVGWGGTPVVGSGGGDIQNTYGYYNPYSSGYGYNPYQPSPYGYPQPSYGYPQQGYGYNYNPYSYSYNPYLRRAYAVTGYDKKSGHFLYG